jgi:hypothetical protein
MLDERSGEAGHQPIVLSEVVGDRGQVLGPP